MSGFGDSASFSASFRANERLLIFYCEGLPEKLDLLEIFIAKPFLVGNHANVHACFVESVTTNRVTYNLISCVSLIVGVFTFGAHLFLSFTPGLFNSPIAAQRGFYQHRVPNRY
jgi:hypothetical protein